MKIALITGISGQDGSYLAEFLLDRGYAVHGIVRRSSSVNRSRIDHLHSWTASEPKRLWLHYGDLADSVSLVKLLYQIKPDEIYNLAAQSHVRISFEIPEYTGDVTGLGAARILEAAIESGIGKKVRYYQASSSEMFGQASTWPQNERTPFHPRSPYGCAKVFAHHLTINYREAYGLFACSGILFNHESPRRGENFVTRKITRAIGRIKAGRQKDLPLGNLDARRDWGYAKEYVEAMWLMLQQEEPRDYVIATGESFSVRDFLETSFSHAGLDWRDHVRFDPRQIRPAEVDSLIGDASKARELLRWKPRTSMRELARLMTDADIALAADERI